MIAEAIDVAVAELRAGQVERTVRRTTVTAELAAIGAESGGGSTPWPTGTRPRA